MKKSLIGLWALSLLLAFSCEQSSSSGGGIFGATATAATETQTWNFMLNPILGLEKYYLKVEISGGNGSVISARMVSGGSETALGNFSVFDGLDLPLADNGPVVKFSNSGGFNLVAPDEWVIMVDSGRLVGVFPTGPNTSTAALSLVSAPTPVKCKYGLFTGFPNLTFTLGGVPQKISALGMQVESSGSQVQGEIPETSILMFSTGYPLVPGSSKVVEQGDSVNVSYTREVVSDGQGGDYFAMVVTNNRTSQVLDGVQAASAGKTRVSQTFVANGDFFGVQLVSALSGNRDSIKIDDFQVKINKQMVFQENFEGPGLKLGFPDYIWQTAQPATMLGSDQICGHHPLAGTQSFCFKGGRSFSLYGQGASVGGVEGMEFTFADGNIARSYFVGSFMGMLSDSVMLGTYSGRNYDKSCQEQGAFINLVNSSQTPDLEGTWDLNINGELKRCDNPADQGAVKIKINDIPVSQAGSFFGGVLIAPDVPDANGNTVAGSGIINGQSLIYTVATKVPATGFYRLSLNGIAGARPITGQVMGWSASNPILLFQTCDLEGSFKLSISH